MFRLDHLKAASCCADHSSTALTLQQLRPPLLAPTSTDVGEVQQLGGGLEINRRAGIVTTYLNHVGGMACVRNSTSSSNSGGGSERGITFSSLVSLAHAHAPFCMSPGCSNTPALSLLRETWVNGCGADTRARGGGVKTSPLVTATWRRTKQ